MAWSSYWLGVTCTTQSGAGGGGIIQKGTVLHAYSWQGNLVWNRIQKLVGHHLEELGLRFSRGNPVGFAAPIRGKTHEMKCAE